MRFEPPSLTCACGGHLVNNPAEDRVQQQIELRPDPLIRREYRAPAYRCDQCGAFHREALPAEATAAGFVGPRLAAALAFLNVKAHASFSALSAVMKDVFGQPLSRGHLSNTLQRVSAALEAPYRELREQLPLEPALHIDETGHKDSGRKMWTWVFRAADFAVFHIGESRSARELEAVLGPSFAGRIGCDYYGAYHKYLKTSGGGAQYCLAHFIRDARFLLELGPEAKGYALRVLAALRNLFRHHHRLLASPGADRSGLRKAGARLRREVLRAPPVRPAENLARRFAKDGDSYLRFIAEPGLFPTNNPAEQTVRYVVIDRYSTQGTRGARGRSYRERMWSVVSTCALRGVSAYRFILGAFEARISDLPAPSILAYR